MQNRNALYQPTPGSRCYKYANRCLKMKDFPAAMRLFYFVTKDHCSTDYQRSIAYIRIGEFYYSGILSDCIFDGDKIPQDDTLAKHFFNLGLKASEHNNPLKRWAESYIKKIDAKRNMADEVTSKMAMATIN